VPPHDAAESEVRAALELMPQLVWTTTADGYHDYYNERWYAFTGMPRPGDPMADAEGWNWRNYLHPDDYERTVAVWGHSLATGDEYEIEYRFREAATGAYRWFLARALPKRDADGRIVRWFGTCTDVDDQRRTSDGLAFLADASVALAASLDYESTLAAAARLAVPRLADWCAVDLLAPGGEFRRVAVEHRDPSKVALAREMERVYPDDPDAPYGRYNVVRTRQPEMMSDIPDAVLVATTRSPEHLRLARELGLRSYIAVPLVARDEVLGVITLVAAESGRRYADADFALAIDFARRAAMAIDQARALRELTESREQLEEQAAELEMTNQQLQEQQVELEAQAEELQVTTEEVMQRTEELERAREDLVRVFEQAPVGISVVRGRDLVYQIANPRYREIMGNRRLVDRAVVEAVPESGAGTAEIMARVLATGEPFVADELCVPLDRDRDGVPESYYFNVVYHPLAADDGEPDGVVTVLVEVTELVRARREAERLQREAQHANAAKSEFLAAMSHELRTPLNAVTGYADLLDLGIRGAVTEEQRNDIGRIKRSGEHLLRLINDILQFAKIEAGQLEFRVDDVPLDESLGELEALVAPQVHAKGLRYEFVPCPAGGDAPVTARADRDKLQQIVLNLLSNAIKATAAGGTISLECAAAAQPGVAVVRVRDSGVGIPADKLDSIFDPFMQVDRKLNRPSEGIGLGLAISRDLARGMGGDLSVESTPGVGSTFTLTLPRGDA
jgi:PAS domain S-box-containing protein